MDFTAMFRMLVLALFGASWRTTLIGLVAAVVTAGAAFLQTQPGMAWSYVAAGLMFLVGRFLKDPVKVVPVAPVAPVAPPKE
jgi:hypothetical protein